MVRACDVLFPPAIGNRAAGSDYPSIAGLPNSDAVFAISNSGSISGNQDLDTLGGSSPNTYTLAGTGSSPDNNGRGTITMTSNGGIGGSSKAVLPDINGATIRIHYGNKHGFPHKHHAGCH